MRRFGFLVCLSLLPLAAQTIRRSVQASGEGIVAVRPDAARVTVSVVKQATTAAEAASQNATTATAVIAAIRQLLGPNADVKTVAYSLDTQYNFPRDGAPAQIIGFIATNTIEAVASDSSLAGRVVDTAVGAGASRVNAVRLFLRDEEPARAQALRVASQRARSRAESIAMGLGVRLGQVMNAHEGVTGAIVPVGRIEGGAEATAVPTPIETGTLEVRATVTADFEIVP